MRLPAHLLMLALLATSLPACLLTSDDDPIADGEVVEDERFDASCAQVGGPLVLPADLSRVESAIGDASCLRVDGNLSIRGDVGSLGSFEELREVRVSGGLVVSGTRGWKNLTALRAVTRVEGDLLIEDCEGLESTEGMVRLQRVGGDFRVRQNADLRLVHGPKNLRQIGADLVVEDNPVVCDMTGFDGLEFIAEYDDRDDRPDAPGAFGGFDPETRPDIVDPHIIVTDNPQLKRIEGFASLTDIDGDIRLERNDELVTIRGFEQLEFMTGRIVIRDQPFLQQIDAIVRPSCLREVILENTAITDFTAFSNVWEIGRLEIVDNDGLAGLGGFREELRLRGPVIVSGNHALRSMSGLGELTTIDLDRDTERETPSVYRESANAFCVETGFGADDQADLVIEDNDALEELGLWSLERVGGGLVVRGNDALTNLDGLSGVQRVSGDIVIESNASLAEVSGFDEMDRLFASITVADNPALVSWRAFKGLGEIRGDLTFAGNTSLERIEGFRGLAEVEALSLVANGIVDLDGFAALRTAESLELSDNESLVDAVDFISLSSVDGELRIERNASLEVLSIPRLERATGLVVQNNPKLSTCEALAIVEQVWSMDYALIEDNAECE